MTGRVPHLVDDEVVGGAFLQDGKIVGPEEWQAKGARQRHDLGTDTGVQVPPCCMPDEVVDEQVYLMRGQDPREDIQAVRGDAGVDRRQGREPREAHRHTVTLNAQRLTLDA